MSTIEEKIIDEIEQDDRLISVAVIMGIYPFLTVEEVFEILEDPLLIETLIIELSRFKNGSIEKANLAVL